jgi:hypothetical protein
MIAAATTPEASRLAEISSTALNCDSAIATPISRITA